MCRSHTHTSSMTNVCIAERVDAVYIALPTAGCQNSGFRPARHSPDFQFGVDYASQKGNVRLSKESGGGPLYDIGIYCFNAARHLFGQEPNEVFAFNASGEDRRFAEVPESTSAILRFSRGRLATFTCNFGAAHTSSYEVIGTKGILRSDPAYERAGASKHYLIVDGRVTERTFPVQDQFAYELGEFSECVLEGREPYPSAEEGSADVRIIEALCRSAESGRPVNL
jgi:predicted dehydrogenase